MKLSGRRATVVFTSLLGFGLLGACAAGADADSATSDSALTVDAGKAPDAAANGAKHDAAAVVANTDPGADAGDEAEAGPVDDAGVDDADLGEADAPDPTSDSGSTSTAVACASNPTYDLSYLALSLIPGSTTPCSGGCSSTQCCYTAHSVCLPK